MKDGPRLGCHWNTEFTLWVDLASQFERNCRKSPGRFSNWVPNMHRSDWHSGKPMVFMAPHFTSNEKGHAMQLMSLVLADWIVGQRNYERSQLLKIIQDTVKKSILIITCLLVPTPARTSLSQNVVLPQSIREEKWPIFRQHQISCFQSYPHFCLNAIFLLKFPMFDHAWFNTSPFIQFEQHRKFNS